MSISITSAEFEAATRMGATSARSARLAKVLESLRAHEQQRSVSNCERLKLALENWGENDPKEISNRNVGQIVSKLANEVIEEHLFCKQLVLAVELANDLLHTRSEHYVNDADTSDENRPALQASALDNLKTVLKPDMSPKAMLATLGVRNRSHWETKGAAAAAKQDMDIRCGESAALAIHVLRKEKGFLLPLSIVEQGNGSIDGHFWVVAGTITGIGEPNYGDDTFTIDLWGAATKHIKSPVVCPARRPFPMINNKIRTLVSWKVGHPDGSDED